MVLITLINALVFSEINNNIPINNKRYKEENKFIDMKIIKFKAK